MLGAQTLKLYCRMDYYMTNLTIALFQTWKPHPI
jgi:hypothetical protein